MPDPRGVDAFDDGGHATEADLALYALDTAGVGYAVEDVRARSLSFSKVFWRILGFSDVPRPLPWRVIMSLVEDRDGWRAGRMQRINALRFGRPFETVLKLRRADDRVGIVLRVRSRPITNADGRLDRIVHVAADMSAEAALQEALEQESLAYQRAQEVARVGHYVLDFRTGQVRGSRMVAQILGVEYPEESASIESVLRRIFTPAQLAASRERRRRAQETGEAYTVELAITAGDTGEQRVIAVSGHPVRDRDGQVTGQFGVVRDITEFRATERTLQERELMLARAEEMGQIGHFYNNFGERRTHFSPMLYQIFGLEPSHDHLLGSYRLRPALPEALIADFRRKERRRRRPHHDRRL